MTTRIHTTILFTTLILVLALAGKAQAGEYTIHNCPASLQSNFDAGPWQSYGGPLPSVGGFQGSCTPGSTLGTAIGWYATAQALNSNLGVVLQSPSSGITIREVRLVWSVSHQSSGSDTFAEVVSDTGSELIDPTPYAAGTSNPAKVYFPDGTHTVYVYSYCSYDDSANCNFPSPTSPVIKLEGMDTTLTDADPPTATINGGSLAASAPVSGNATLQFTATDGQSGVRESQLLIDGSPVAADNYSSQCSYANFAACPQSQVNSMTWNTNTVANGEHRVALRITDAAGNTHTVDDHSVTVANASATGPSAEPPACAEAPGTRTKITVAAKHHLLVSGYRQRARLSGKLLGAGKPISAGTVEILTRPAVSSGKFLLLGHVTTGAHGQFKLILPPGISRTVCLRYHALPGGVYTAALAVTEQVRAGVTLAVHPRVVESNGTIILTGNVLGGYISGAGKVVELQVLYLGSWRVFQTVRTRPDGQFTSFYSFLGGQGIFAFRASVRGENDYPYALGYSHPVRVRAG
jgi:hypothetical protein